jgi:hypothetical protein
MRPARIGDSAFAKAPRPFVLPSSDASGRRDAAIRQRIRQTSRLRAEVREVGSVRRISMLASRTDPRGPGACRARSYGGADGAQSAAIGSSARPAAAPREALAWDMRRGSGSSGDRIRPSPPGRHRRTSRVRRGWTARARTRIGDGSASMMPRHKVSIFHHRLRTGTDRGITRYSGPRRISRSLPGSYKRRTCPNGVQETAIRSPGTS